MSDLLGLDEESLEPLSSSSDWLVLPGGSVLFHQGDPGDALYFVLTGTLAVVGANDDSSHVIATIQAGETVGEMALLSGEPRSATVIALRDTELLRLSSDGFMRIVAHSPTASLRLARLLVSRLRRMSAGTQLEPQRKTISLLFPEGSGGPGSNLLQAVVDTWAHHFRRIVVLGADAADRDAAWFQAMETAHDLVVYRAPLPATSWTSRCIRQSDHVVFMLTPDRHSPELSARCTPLQRSTLICIHDGVGLAERAQALACSSGISEILNVRRGVASDAERAARILIGRGLSLVLSGGGARGIAHLGVVRALRQAGVQFDCTGGTSVGAIIAAGVAMEWDDAELLSRFRSALMRANPVGDLGLPLIALTRGRRLTGILRQHFGDRSIEELWVPFFCVSADLTDGRLHLHQEGRIWRALRASSAVPGVVPPIIDQGKVLVDGGVIDNFPIATASRISDGPIIGSNVGNSAFPGLDRDPEDLPLSAWFRKKRRPPGIFSLLVRAGTVNSEIQMRAALDRVSLLFSPPLDEVGLLEWSAFDRVVEIGYRYASERLEQEDPVLRGLLQ